MYVIWTVKPFVLDIQDKVGVWDSNDLQVDVLSSNDLLMALECLGMDCFYNIRNSEVGGYAVKYVTKMYMSGSLGYSACGWEYRPKLHRLRYCNKEVCVYLSELLSADVSSNNFMINLRVENKENRLGVVHPVSSIHVYFSHVEFADGVYLLYYCLDMVSSFSWLVVILNDVCEPLGISVDGVDASSYICSDYVKSLAAKKLLIYKDMEGWWNNLCM